jgi:hypothetical protein
MALFVQTSLKTVNAYVKLSVKNSVETELSNHKRTEKKRKLRLFIWGFVQDNKK